MDHPVLTFLALSPFLIFAAVWDCRFNRIPNLIVFTGLTVCPLLYAFNQTGGDIGDFFLGVLVGFILFFPFYFFRGMAAGDVKLMAMVGGYLGPEGAFGAVILTLVAGGVLGVLILILRRQLFQFFQRYWAMASLRAYISPEADDAASQRFPYAIAILVGTSASYFWHPFAQ